MIEFLGVIFVLVILVVMLVWKWLTKQAVAYIRICNMYTNKLLCNEISVSDYTVIMSQLKEGLNPLLKWYLDKEGYA